MKLRFESWPLQAHSWRKLLSTFFWLIFSYTLAQGQESEPASSGTYNLPASLENGINGLGQRGAQFRFNYWGEAFANLSGGVQRGGDYEGLLKLSLGLDLEKLARWDGASFYASVLYPHGNGITDQYVHDYNILSNIDAYDTVRVFELWVQQTLFDGKFSIRIGQLTTDNDFFVSSDSALFINSAFGTIGTVLHDVNAPIYPVASEGIRLQYDFTPSLYIQAMAMDDDPGFQNLNDKYGARFGIFPGHGVLGFFEAGYIPVTSDSNSGLGSDYKLGAFADSQFHPDIGINSDRHADYGFYTVVDQPLYVVRGENGAASRGISGFLRTSVAPDSRNAVEYYFDTGLNWIGPFKTRPTDIFGVAFSFERLGSDLALSSEEPVLSHHEHVIEMTYLANINAWFSLQPDFQYIINPGGTGDIPNSFVVGLRFNISF